MGNLPLYKLVVPRVAASGECGGGLGAVAPAVGDEGPQHVAVEDVVDDDDDDDNDDDVDADDADEVVADVEEGVAEEDVVLLFVAVCVFDNFKSLDFIMTVAVAVVVVVAFTKILSPTTSISSSSSMVDRSTRFCFHILLRYNLYAQFRSRGTRYRCCCLCGCR